MMYVQKFKFRDGKYIQQKKTPTVKKFCKDCQHFSKNGQVCKLFTAVDIVNGTQNNVRAIDARENINMCGYGGAEFEPLDNKKKQDENTTDFDDIIVTNVVFNTRP